jgi:hypothetical protein
MAISIFGSYYDGLGWHLVGRQYVVPGIVATGMQELQPIPGIKKGVSGWAGVIRNKGATNRHELL